jgi:hypothetical protein
LKTALIASFHARAATKPNAAVISAAILSKISCFRGAGLSSSFVMRNGIKTIFDT